MNINNLKMNLNSFVIYISMMMKLSPTSYFKNYLYENPCFIKSKRCKVSINDFHILNFNEHDLVLTKNYNVSQLKSMCRYYKLKVSGNKKELITRVWNFLKFSKHACMIQKIWRGFIIREFTVTSKIKDCVNSTDFLLLDDLKNISPEQIFCFKDDDGFVYGFHVKSFHNLIIKNYKPTNPYNRKVITKSTINKFNKFIKYGTKIGKQFELEIKDETTELTLQKQIELQTHSVFHKIDEFGHITDTSWFLSLNRLQLKKLLLELIDIWNYRASLTPQAKMAICPPNGNPFYDIDVNNFQTYNIEKMQKKILKIFDKLLTRGIDQNSKSLGAFYILGSITLVNHNAAIALPWLYESVYYNPVQNN
jgi:hypothetical protein